MFCVPCYLAPSLIQGIGIFAAKLIKKDTVIWDFIEGYDLALTPEQIQKLPKPAQDVFDYYGFIDAYTGKTILCADLGRYRNHSRTPNVYEGVDGDLRAYAARDIAKDEELTCDYRALHPSYAELPWV